jgi:aldehyde dehydrogenase (NAD+)
MREFGSLIGGDPIQGAGWIEVRNPYTGNMVGRVSAARADGTMQAIQTMKAARIALSRYERYTILDRMARRLEELAPEIGAMITDESGLCLKDTQYEVLRACDVLRFSAIRCLDDDSQVFPCDVSRNGRSRRIYTMRQPIGLVCAITPFNHPLNQVVHKVAPAIAAGTKVILKPSQLTPLTAHYFIQLAMECGVPPEMVGVLSFSSNVGSEGLITHPAVQMITFTGSTDAGRRIAAVAGYKRLVLELGGSSAMLVLADADPVLAADIAVAGIFKNSGQRCTAIRRLLVHESIADEFARLLIERTEMLKFGDPYDPATDMGTLISEKAAIEIERRVNQSLAQGAKLLTGHERRGAGYAPTVLDFVTNDSPVVACETFGPVAPILRFRTLDEAITIANDTEFGLSGAVVSDHWPSIQRVICELETGAVNVNEAPSYRLEWSPFGGIKSSGLGYKEGVIEAMKSMTYVKTYSLPWQQP